MPKQSIVLLAVAGLLVSLTGCNEPAPPAKTGPAVVVVDLNAVARAVGTENDARVALEQAKAQLEQRLTEIRNNMAQQIEDKKAEFGVDEPNEEQMQTLQAMANQANAKLRQARVQAQVTLQQYQQQIGLQFRDQVKPIAERLAKDLGAEAAIITNPGALLWHDPGADITDEVIAELRAEAAATPQPTPAEDGESDAETPAGDG